MIDFTGVSSITIPEGNVAKITNAAGDILWQKPAGEDYKELYQRVDYLYTKGGTSGGWFLTDFIPNNTSGMEFTFAVPSFSDVATMGTRTSASNTRCYIFYPRTTSVGYIGWNTAQSWTITTAANTKYITRMNWLASKKAVLLKGDGSSIGSKSMSGTLVQQVSPVAICRYNNATSTPSGGRAMYVYGARFTQGSEIVREYLPCYRKSDGIMGLYETFTNTFVESQVANGFTKGEDIEWEEPVANVASTFSLRRNPVEEDDGYTEPWYENIDLGGYGE